jgi:hypothetical protein
MKETVRGGDPLLRARNFSLGAKTDAKATALF